MHVNAETLSVTLTFANPALAARFFLRPLVARGSFAAKAALAQLDRGEGPDWEAANDAALARQVATAPAAGEDLRPAPTRFWTETSWDAVIFGGGRSWMVLRDCEVSIGAPWWPSEPDAIADAIAGRLLGGLAPRQQTSERRALARKVLALWAKDRKDRVAAAARAAEEERLARRSGVTVEVYRERLAKAARRSGRAGAGGKRNWTARRAA